MQSSLELQDEETAFAHVSSIKGECGHDAEPVGVCRDPLTLLMEPMSPGAQQTGNYNQVFICVEA